MLSFIANDQIIPFIEHMIKLRVKSIHLTGRKN